MTTVNVRFLQACGDDRAGDEKLIDIKRAQRLARQGYVEIRDRVPEAAITPPIENASAPKSIGRGPKPERRG